MMVTVDCLRLSRVFAELCLAKTEHTNLRLFSLSSVFEENRNDYYQHLENQQRGTLDLTCWINWFLSQVETAAINAKQEFERVIQTTVFFGKNINQLSLTNDN